jgi:XTP/dITP diphosphohydrolase
MDPGVRRDDGKISLARNMTPMNKIVLATSNRGKLAEMLPLLSGTGIELVTQAELGVQDAIEDGHTFIENALIKARHASTVTGLPAIADDSG